MKKLLILVALISFNASAQEVRYANVVSVTPLTDNVKVIKQQCGGSAGYHEENSFVGKIVGGLTGLFIGSNVGKGKGRTAAQIGGTAIGVAVGNAYDNDQSIQPNCRAIETYEPTYGGFEVVYELDGEQYAVRSQTFPQSRTIQIKMTPTIAE